MADQDKNEPVADPKEDEQREGGVKEEGKGEANPETSTPNTDASADAE